MYFDIPNGTQRVVLVSNVMQPPPFQFHDGDLVIEFNRAVHHPKIQHLKQANPQGITDYLFVRHNKSEHFLPSNFDKCSTTWDNIILTSPRFGLSTESWFRAYCKATKKTPTTGYAVYKMIRQRDRRIPIIGLGFNLDDKSTPHNPMHDWGYEYTQYNNDKNFTNL